MRYHLILGNQAYSSWSLRGWLLLEAFGLEFEHEVVPLYVPEYEQFVDANFPASTVPTLLAFDGDDKLIIWDSLAMAEFIHEQHPEAGIWPADMQARATARSLCAEMHSSYAALRSTMPVNVRREYKTFTPGIEAQADIERIDELWHWARSRWGRAGPYLFGENFCAVDAFYAPVASRFRTYGITLRPESQAYADALLAHPATQAFCEAGQRESRVLEFNEFDIA
ncbi:glutathione S-transferase [Gammaproteobacteria bacterium]|nr:glutathione S-transferase [Gammaproteobacteria bacterium]